MFRRARGERAAFIRVGGISSADVDSDGEARNDEDLRPPSQSASTFVETQEMSNWGEAQTMTIPKGLEHLKHGDLFRMGDVAYRAAGVFVVNYATEHPTALSISNDSEHGVIPIEVTSGIEEPEAFYVSVREACDIVIIELNAAFHGELLKTLAGGRIVAPERKVYCVPGIDFDSPCTIKGPPGPDLAREEALSVPLNSLTPLEYLSSASRLEVDPIMARCRVANRAAHEVQASAYFGELMREREDWRPRLTLCSIPTDKDDHRWAASSAVLKLCRIHPENPLRVVSVVVQSSASGVFVCKPRVITSKGPFGGVNVWCEEGPAASWMIDLSDLADLPEYE
jgi:hypothetical protein